jgi:signal transduction histidine kinase
MIGFFGIGVHADAALREGRAIRQFTSKDLETLAVFARHAAIAIGNARMYEREQQRTERVSLIARIGHIMTANLSLSDLLQRAADAIHDLLGYPNIAIPLLHPGDPPVLVLNTVGGSYKHIVKTEFRMPITEGIMGAAVRTNSVVLVNDVQSDSRHVPTPGATGINAELAVPIHLGERVLGVLNVESSDPFTAEDAASLEIVADQLAVAIENARLYDHGQRVAVLEERQRLARDLHDSVTQHIFGMNLIAQSLASAWHRDAVEGERRVDRLVELGRTAMTEMRALLAELRPVETEVDAAGMTPGLGLLRARGLVTALDKHITDLAGDEPVIELDARNYRRQDSGIEEALFRIAQESLANVIKHAQAHHVSVRLRTESGRIRLEVRDDGVGFRPRDVHRSGSDSEASGLGLSTMAERAAALNGTVDIRSSPGRGTVVEAVLPIDTGGAT